MISLRELSIPKKVVAITMIVAGAALLFASAALIGYDFIAVRRDLRAGATTLARIAADNLTAALSFNDQAAAADTLNALRSEPSIAAACVYTDAGLFAQYVSGPGAAPCPARPASGPEEAGYLLVSAPVQLKGQEIGSIQMRATLSPAYARLRMEILIIAGILVLSALFAFGLSAHLHKLISEPILNLSRTANEVYRRKDYSIRAAKQSEDELGALVDSFNRMLTQIQTMFAEIHAREAALEERTAALARANEELQKASQMKDEFLATLSHELRTPLTAVFGWLNLLRAGRLDREKAAKALEVIDRNLKLQIQLVDDLLNMSRIISGKMRVWPAWTDAGAVIGAAVDSVQPSAAAKGVDISIEMGKSAEQIFADPERLQQVIWNLLTNAVKFTDRDGHIRIACSRAGTKLQIAVSDTGEGIDPKFIPFLFERFTQADASKTRKHGGLGLGLAIVRHIVESHGGTVSACSEGKKCGSTFVVQLPLPPLVRAAAKEPQPAATASLQGLKVMLVEDEPDAREMVAETLEQYGASVLQAASGPEALRALATQEPDVLISDIGMPDMDGYELIERIRSEYPPRFQTMPAVALTAFAGQEDKEKSFEAGYQAHLVKPVGIAELVAAIASVVGKSAH